MDAWVELGLSAYRLVWDRFYAEFDFRPSVHSRDFPGIKEPRPSVTYALPRVDGQPRMPTAEESDDLDAAMLAAFRACTPLGMRIYALDWQHPSYFFDPHADFEEWAVPVVPNGDYYIFLSQSFSWGVFGHPWEWTMCVFGEPLLAALERRRPRLFGTPIRRK